MIFNYFLETIPFNDFFSIANYDGINIDTLLLRKPCYQVSIIIF